MTAEAGSWDYIVVGAGSAGCIVANRLSADPSIRVLLLEAGGEANQLKFKVPALGPLTCLGDPGADWNFATEQDPSRGGRTDFWPRGKALGGSSAINGTVYVRGNRGDYDHWRQLGNAGWGYDDLLPLFHRVERRASGPNAVYGQSGAISISEVRGPHPLARVFLSAMAELGTPTNPAYNGEEQTGAAITHVNQSRGWRVSASRAYLDPIRGRANLKIITGAVVRRIVMDGRRAAGVEFDRDGATQTARADGEIILSASAINSPKILMLSGIGPGDALTRHGIPIVHDNPAVGANLQEHVCAHVVGLVNVRTSNLDVGKLSSLKHAARFALFGSGAATYVAPAIAFVKTRPELDYPDVQFHFGVYGYEFTPEGVRMLDKPAITLQPNVNRSRSRGFLTLRSPDPLAPPLIYPNMLGDPHDLETLVKGVQYGRRLLRTKAFAPYFVGEYKPGDKFGSDAELRDHVRAAASGVFHPCGTCKMGVDAQSVVDPDLRVKGIDRLRVVDSAIIPQIPSGNINAISLVIGEKGSEAILKSRRA
jgi:choline dehydrogenase